MFNRTTAVVWFTFAAVTSFAHGAEDTPAVSAPQSVPMELVSKQLGGIKPLHVLGDIYLAGQPRPQDIDLLSTEGVKTVITLRKRGEVPWDEGAIVMQHGMKLVEVPFQSPEELKPAVFDKVRKVLLDKKRGPTVLHCGSANRVGAIWYAHRVLDAKVDPSVALEEARIIGLRTPQYLEKAQAYVQSEQRKPAKPASATR
ncbi:MAG: hypothetical protein AAGD11_08635 [Planctomycetota bacterium]